MLRFVEAEWNVAADVREIVLFYIAFYRVIFLSSTKPFHSHRPFEWLGWLVVLRINVDLAIFQPYLDLEAGDNQSLKIQVARPGIEPRSSCSASQELNHSATAAPCRLNGKNWPNSASLPISLLFILKRAIGKMAEFGQFLPFKRSIPVIKSIKQESKQIPMGSRFNINLFK